MHLEIAPSTRFITHWFKVIWIQQLEQLMHPLIVTQRKIIVLQWWQLGKESITHYEVIEFYRGVSMVKIELETGRTHQIRVHFSALHHPLVGDTTYGADPVLAKSLQMSQTMATCRSSLASPTQLRARLCNFYAPYPADLTRSLALLSDAVLP